MSFLKAKPAKSSQSSLSENVNNSQITKAYSPQIGEGTGANNYIAQLLGISPAGTGVANDIGNDSNTIAQAFGAQAGYNNYLQNAGYAPAMRQLSQNITGQAAGAGLLNSGSTARALQTRGTELNQGFFNNYLQQLSGLSGLGLQAGGLTANTGQKSTSTGMSIGPQESVFNQVVGSIGKAAQGVGGVASVFASDRRLKRDIVKEGEFDDGLGIYSFRFVGEAKRQAGVMADEVEKLRPWALGPKKAGFATVDYGKL